MDAVIEVRELRKTYADGTEAVRGISFAVRRGEFFGFLGPNGAGKSTAIKMLITLLARTSGEARILGLDLGRDAAALRQQIGYAAQTTGLDDDLSGAENLLLIGRLYHLPRSALARRVEELLELMDLTADAHRPAGSYSGGMRKRLDLATSLIHRPQLLFLDEPTTGLDPQNRANLWSYLERLNQEERLTIFLTTHYMEEADRLCQRLAIIDHGRIIAEGSPGELKAQLGGDVVSLAFQQDGQSLEQQQRRAAEALGALAAVRQVTPTADGVSATVADGGAAVPQLLRALEHADLTLSRLSLASPTLDDVFLKHTGHSIRQEELSTTWKNRRGMFRAR